MDTYHRKYSPYFTSLARVRLRYFLACVVVITVILSPLQPALAAPKPTPDRLGLLTVGVVLGTTLLVKNLVGGMIEKAGEEARDTLRETEQILDRLIVKLRTSYRDALEVTLDQLDEFSRTQLTLIHGLVQDIMIRLELGLEKLNEKILEDIKTISLEIEARLAQVEDLAIVVLTGTILLIDKATFNLALIVDLVILAVGIIVFIILLFLRKLPTETLSRRLALGGIAIFLAIFGIFLLPQGRAFALTFAGFGEQLRALEKPDIFQVRPEVLVLGETKEVFLVGTRLAPQGQPPLVEIAGVEAPVVASDQLVAVQVAELDLSGHLESQIIRLRTENGQVATALIRVLAEPPPLPDLVISSFQIEPSSPVEDGNAQAKIVVKNQGAGPAARFRVDWRPIAALTIPPIEVSGLGSGESKDILFNFAYIKAGSFETVAIADSFNQADESDELNNTSTRTIVVQENVTPKPIPRQTVKSTVPPWCAESCGTERAECLNGKVPGVSKSDCDEHYEGCVNACR